MLPSYSAVYCASRLMSHDFLMTCCRDASIQPVEVSKQAHTMHGTFYIETLSFSLCMPVCIIMHVFWAYREQTHQAMPVFGHRF